MKKLVLILFIIPSLAFGAAPTDYVSCWDLEETSGTRIDANTTNSNDLTDNNTVTSSSTGKVGTAADFEKGNTEYLNISDANQAGLDITGDIGLMVWYKPESQPPSGEGQTWASKYAAGSGAYAFMYQNSAGTMQLVAQLHDSADPTGNIGFRKNQTLSNGTWYHIAMSYDTTSNTMGYWVNGAAIGSTTGEGIVNDINNSTGNFEMGTYQTHNAYAADGLMDVVEIYNRELTSQNVIDTYNSGSGVGCSGRGIQTVDVGAAKVNIGSNGYVGSNAYIGL